jgi:hypothetical protein
MAFESARLKLGQRERLLVLLNRAHMDNAKLNQEVFDLEAAHPHDHPRPHPYSQPQPSALSPHPSGSPHQTWPPTLKEISKHSTRVLRARGVELERLDERLRQTNEEISNWCYNPDYNPSGVSVEEYAIKIQKRWKARCCARKITAAVKAAVENRKLAEIQRVEDEKMGKRRDSDDEENMKEEEDIVWEPPDDEIAVVQTARSVPVKMGEPGVQSTTDKLAFFRTPQEITFGQLKLDACNYFTSELETIRAEEVEMVDSNGERWLSTQCVYNELAFLPADGTHHIIMRALPKQLVINHDRVWGGEQAPPSLPRRNPPPVVA